MDILTDGHHRVQRLEVVDCGRRRRWTEAEKLKVVHERLSRPRLVSLCASTGYPAAFTELAQGMARGLTWPGSGCGGDVPAIVTPELEAASERSALEESRVEIVTASGRRIAVRCSCLYRSQNPT